MIVLQILYQYKAAKQAASIESKKLKQNGNIKIAGTNLTRFAMDVCINIPQEYTNY